MDFGFHNCMARAFLTYTSAEEVLKTALQQDIDAVHKCVSSLDSRLDKQRFLEFNNSAFMIPKKFEFQGHKGDEVRKSSSPRDKDLIVAIHIHEVKMYYFRKIE